MADEKKPADPRVGVASWTKLLDDLLQREETKELFAKATEEARKSGAPETDPLTALVKLMARLKTDAQKRAAETNRVDTADANTWLKEHWRAPHNCAICTENNWGIAPTFVHIPEGPIGKGPVGTYQPVRSVPCVLLTCRTCGNTLFLNAVVMGLLPKGEE